MLTKNEITALSLSPTKKDFVQIWNELLEIAGKLSERWDPTSTNESDPGIVILKAVTGIADKLNYNIDKNTLEAFMPTAAQEDSMRKLCDMLGYTMKYYQSAETTINIKYYNSDPSDAEATQMATGLYIPKFTVITNSDKDINYFTTNKAPIYISSNQSSVLEIPCMEGQLVKCESINSNNIITINQISENNRFYLPETQIAENGIFIYNVDTQTFDRTKLNDGIEWTKVDNLNVQARGARVFKFGYDSYESRPYIEFPEDYSELFNEGLFIYYTRTNGINGNISTRTLTQIELPSTDGWTEVSAESFSVENVFSATSGANLETIKQAYNNFKKTVGTFETLVTCRDYMNKIYSLTNNGKHLVSNILVTDIRNDLNRAVSICSCDDAGIFYKETPLSSNVPVSDVTKPIFNNSAWHLGSVNGVVLENIISDSTFDGSLSGEVLVQDDYWAIKQGNTIFKTNLPIGPTEPAINSFDLIFYPFKSYNQIRSNLRNNLRDIRTVYDASFSLEPDISNIEKAINAEGIKTISHTTKSPRKGDLISINNYLRLNATIATNTKVTEIERNLIVDNIKIALANAFNMRELDFGDEIPFDSIVEVIETADSRIRVASLNEPALYTTFSILEDDNFNTPRVVEYAVASDWLDADIAESTGRLFKTEKAIDSDGKEYTKTISTFDSKEARKIYNQLVVRNILAGRVPLFNYNTSFKTSFLESAYQVTTLITTRPTDLPEPTIQNPFTIWTENGVVYTGQLTYDEFGNIVYDEQGNPKVIYTETKTPIELEGILEENIIKETTDDAQDDTANNSANLGVSDATNSDNSTINKDYITNISTNCKIFTDEYDTITDVKLEAGEFVKFRAPNFTTKKTYPAYVNYHLDLDTDLNATAVSAEAASLYEVLNSDIGAWSNDNKNINWQKVLDYFESIDSANGTSYKKTFTIKQLVTANKASDESINITQGSLSTVIGVDTDNSPEENVEYTAEELMTLSGCVKLTNKDFKVRVEWTPQDGAPDNKYLPELYLEGFNNPFINNVNILSYIKTQLDEALATYKTALFDKTVEDACLGHSFTVYLDFECVPFETKSLTAWEKFVSTCALYHSKDYRYQVFSAEPYNFKPIAENDVFLWRLTDNSSYEIGKYVTIENRKLLKFSKNYFTSIQDEPLKGIYIVKDFGSNAEPAIIKNNEEYKLRQNERLFIEYTPSNTSEDGASQKQDVVTEVYGEGTIIRPSGFEVGLIDSSLHANNGNTPNKTVTFVQAGNTPVLMFSLGASEQIEIRDLAKVELSKDSFSGASSIYIYKNFNGCSELEKKDTDANGGRINNTYTLNDGEYIFYTDKNKTDFAYYTSGTQVTLLGNLTLPECDIIELSTIFDSGLQGIPWRYKSLEAGDQIILQEYQYTTLGPGDTIKNLVLVGRSATDDDNSYNDKYLDENWQYCSEVKYTVADAPDTNITLSAVNLSDRPGNGWEACSILELDVTANSAQTLRSTDKIQTSLTLSRTSTAGGSGTPNTITPVTSTVSSMSLPLSFKTNLACQACGNSIDIKDIYTNIDNLKGFQLKVFAEDTPVIVATRPGTVAPYVKSGLVDINTWTGEPLSTKDYQELWTQVSVDRIMVSDAPNSSTAFDNALRLSISLLQNTFGIFCIYIDNSSTSDDKNAKIWIEAIPGTKSDSITLINATETGLDAENRLYLNTGINCIRVNNTCKLFIKASKKAQGVLYFDEPKLVNKQKLEYINADNKPITLYTNGLNLEQLGYLDVSEVADNRLDEATRIKLHTAYIDKAYNTFDDAVKTADDTISQNYEALQKLLQKVQLLVDAEKLIDEELTNISSIDDNKLIALVTKYNEISETLTNERTLLEALKNNVKADDIEQQLIALLASFSTIDAYQQQILEELATLKAKARASVENLSEANILADYNAIAKNSDLTDTFAEIKKVAAENIERSYQEQLSVLINNLEQAVNAEDRSNLLAILASLRATEVSDTQAKLRVLISKLNDALEQEAINNTLVEMTEAAATQDYVRLYSLAATLSGLVEYRGLSVIAAELSIAVGDSNDTQLAALVTELKTLVAELDNPTPTSGSLSALINELIAAVKEKVDGGTTTVDITQKVKDINDEFISDFKAKLSAIATDLQACVDSLQTKTPINELIELLEGLEDSQNTDSYIRAIVDNIKDLVNDCASFKDKLNNAELAYNNWNSFTYKSISSFIQEAIIAVWPANITDRLYNILSSIDSEFTKALTGKSTEFNKYKDELAAIFDSNSEVTDILINALNVPAFTELFKQIKTLLSTKEQNAVNKALISEIGGYVTNSVELSSALNKTGGNSIITTLIEDWRAATDVVQKQRLQQSLIEELEKVVIIDEQLFNIIAGLLCPNIQKLEAEIDKTDNFFEKFLTAINDIKTKLLDTASVTGASMVIDSEYLALLELTLVNFRAALGSFDKPKASLLPNDFVNNIDSIKNIFDTITADTEILKLYPITATTTISELAVLITVVNNSDIKDALKKLYDDLTVLNEKDTVEPGYEGVLQILRLEDQLLAEIRKIDVNRDFYYGVSVEDRLAIELNESNKKLNTLMNPAVNYDINNVNNTFVISKLDIDYLNNGIQIARSSRLN